MLYLQVSLIVTDYLSASNEFHRGLWGQLCEREVVPMSGTGQL